MKFIAAYFFGKCYAMRFLHKSHLYSLLNKTPLWSLMNLVFQYLIFAVAASDDLLFILSSCHDLKRYVCQKGKEWSFAVFTQSEVLPQC